MGPIQNRIRWGLAICLLVASYEAGFGQFNAQLPTNPWQSGVPQAGLGPQNGFAAPPGPGLGGGFDPNAPAFRPIAPGALQNANPYGNYGNPTNSGWSLGNLFNWGQPTSPYGYPYSGQSIPTTPQPFGQPTFGQPAFGQPAYPSSIYPNQSPGVLFPGVGSPQPSNSIWNQPNPSMANPYQLNPYQANPYQANPYQGGPFATNPFNFGQNNPSWNNWWNAAGTNLNNGTNQVIRLFQGPRFRHTWLPGTNGFSGKKPNSLESNDSDISLVFAVPNFLNSSRPLYIIPSYTQHAWDGPTAVGSDLPGSAFSGFLDSGWETNPLQTLGTELAVRVGVFSAFDAINTDSIRVQGKALGRLRLTPTATLRAGVFYLDRNKIKILPAGGILWVPNQDTRFDLFFPEPKLSHYVATLGNSDVWWYLTGYYGGGAWTIKQTDGSHDEIDINDIRLMLGLEFGKSDQIRQGFRLGFIEAGYAFNRELLYRVRSSGNLDLENSFVLRAGFAY